MEIGFWSFYEEKWGFNYSIAKRPENKGKNGKQKLNDKILKIHLSRAFGRFFAQLT